MKSKFQYQEHLHQKELEDYARFPEMNPGPVLRFDTSGNILLANKAARNLFGKDNIIRGNWIKICPGFNEEMWQEIIETKEQLSIETDIDQKCIMFNSNSQVIKNKMEKI